VYTTVLAINHIVKTQGVCGGAARIDGTRLTVDWIVGQMVYAGRTLAEMVEDYAHIPLTPAQIHAALAYYYDHQADIDALIGESEAQLVEIQHPGYVTAREAAELLGLAHESRQVARLSRQGVLRGRKVANRWLISRASIETYRKTERKPGPRTA